MVVLPPGRLFGMSAITLALLKPRLDGICIEHAARRCRR